MSNQVRTLTHTYTETLASAISRCETTKKPHEEKITSCTNANATRIVRYKFAGWLASWLAFLVSHKKKLSNGQQQNTAYTPEFARKFCDIRIGRGRENTTKSRAAAVHRNTSKFVANRMANDEEQRSLLLLLLRALT